MLEFSDAKLMVENYRRMKRTDILKATDAVDEAIKESCNLGLKSIKVDLKAICPELYKEEIITEGFMLAVIDSLAYRGFDVCYNNDVVGTQTKLEIKWEYYNPFHY